MYQHCTFDSSVFYSLALLDRRMSKTFVDERVNLATSGKVYLIMYGMVEESNCQDAWI